MSRWQRGAIIALLLAGACVAVVFTVLAAGVTIDATRWRDWAAQRASAALDRPVELPGAVRLTLGRELKLRLGGLRILNAAGFTAPALLTVGEATVVVDLFELLRGQPEVRAVEADDVVLWLEHAADGRGNWANAASAEPGTAGADLHVGRFRLNRVMVHHHDTRTASRRAFDFESLAGGMAPGGALQLQLHGRMDAWPAYRLTLDGGPLRLLRGGTEPWPFTLSVKAGGAVFDASGALDVGRGEARLDFSGSADEPARAGRRLGLALPPLGRVSLRGRAVARADTVELTQLQGNLPGAELAGRLTWAGTGPRPRLTGALNIVDLDLRPTLDALAVADRAATERAGTAWQNLALREIVPFDTDLELAIDRWSGLPIDVRGLKLRLQADAGGLRAPIEAQVAGAATHGRVELDTASPTPTLAVQWSADGLPLGELARQFAGLQDFDGTVGRVNARAGGAGQTLGAWVRNLDASIEVTALAATLAAAQAAAPAAAPIALKLDSLKLQAARGERLRGHASGSLQGERITLSMAGPQLAAVLDGQALPTELALAAAPATLRVATDLAALRAGDEAAWSFDFRARRSGDLARWLGVAPSSTLPVAMNGRMRGSDQAWFVDSTRLQIGRSELTVQARLPRQAGGAAVTTARVRSALLDVPELSTLRATAAPAAAPKSAALAAAPQPAALAAGQQPAALAAGQQPAAPAAGQPPAAGGAPFEIADLDLALDLQQVKLARAELHDLRLAARIRHGQLRPAPLTGRVGSTPFDGVVEADLRGEAPTGRIELSARQVDVGRLLRELGAADDIVEGQADALEFSLSARGRDGREVVERTEVRARLRGGTLALRRDAQRPLAAIRLRDAAIELAPGEPLRVKLEGTLDQAPVDIELRTGTLAEWLGNAERMPLAMTARGAGTLLVLEGDVALPLGRAADLRLQWSGERLDSLNSLSQVELPAWGPWSIAGPIRMTPGGYEVPGLQVQVGQSRLAGAGRLDLSGPRPHLALQVTAPSIQLDDFPLPAQLDDPPPRPVGVDALRGAADTLTGRTDRLLSAGFLRRFDADVDVRVDELLSGVDRLADAAVRLKLREGRLDLDPVVVNVPGGSLKLSAAYDLKASEVDFALAATVERFDYGIIARRMARGDDIQGQFSLKVKLQGRAPSLGSIFQNADGEIDIAVWPRELRSGVFNLWSVNLVLSLMPLIDPGSSSGVNCVIGRFDLKDGIVSEDTLLIDTTRVRIRGTGQANLRTEQLDFVFRPRGKGVAIFRLQNPLRVTGSLFDQRIGLDRRDLPESVLRLIASPILWPIEQFTLGRMPRDGADICSDPMRALAP